MVDFRKRRRGRGGIAVEDGSSIPSGGTGVSSGESGITGPGGSNPFRLPQIGPVMPSPVSIGDYTYRNNVTNPVNKDKIESIGFMRQIDLAGRIISNAAVDIVSSNVEDVNTHFWPHVYIMLHEMAQMRDGYKSQDSVLTVPLNAKYRDHLILKAKSNIRTLWALYHCTMYNEAHKSTITAFQGKYSRMRNLLDWSNKLIYPSALDQIIDYWSTVYTPYPGGPVVYNLFEFAAESATCVPKTSVFTVWAANPDLNDTADITDMLDDITLAFEMVDQYKLNVAADAVDFKLITSMYKMMSFDVPQTPVKGLIVDNDRFRRDFMTNAFKFIDTKGLGGDIVIREPDIAGVVDGLITVHDMGVPSHPLDLIGMSGVYAYDLQDSATPGYCAIAEKVLSLGGPETCDFLGSVINPPRCKIYTQEDGWASITFQDDITDVDGCQAWIWSQPIAQLHPLAWTVVKSEEAEEDYRSDLLDGPRTYQMPWDHVGERYNRWIHEAYKIPFVR